MAVLGLTLPKPSARNERLAWALGSRPVSTRAIVTGAASGIGRAVAAALVDGGAQVLAVDLQPDPDDRARRSPPT